VTINDQVLAFVMAGGRGARLKMLTKNRCKPAVDIFGHHRIFDFVASNIANTGINTALIATQFKRQSLHEYIGIGERWGFDGIRKKLEIVSPNGEGCSSAAFEGTADSVRKSIGRIDTYNPGVVLVLGGDHVYTMNYRDAIKQHKINNADITIMTNVVPDSKVSDLGIVKIDESGRIIDFAEKPTDKEVIEDFRLTTRMKDRLGIDNPNLNFLASMGNYVFFWDRLKRFLDFPGVDFGKDTIPAMKDNGGSMYTYVFNGYWRDVGRVRDYFDCNMDFTRGRPPIAIPKDQAGTCGDPMPFLRTSTGSPVQRAILSSGDEIHPGSAIKDSVLGYDVVVDGGCKIDHCIFLGAERSGFCNSQAGRECATYVGKGSILSYVILDSNVRVGEGVNIGPHNGTPEERKGILRSIGLKPYTENSDGTVDGDFSIEPDIGILVIGKQNNNDSKEAILPDGLEC